MLSISWADNKQDFEALTKPPSSGPTSVSCHATLIFGVSRRPLTEKLRITECAPGKFSNGFVLRAPPCSSSPEEEEPGGEQMTSAAPNRKPLSHKHF